MEKKYIIFVGYEPDKNSGGNSMIPSMIKRINSLFVNPIVYFYILFNRNFGNDDNLFNYMNTFAQENLPIAQPFMIKNKNNIVIYPENCGNPLNFQNIVRFNLYFNIYEPSKSNEYVVFFASPFKRLYNQIRNLVNVKSHNIDNSNIYPQYINYFYNINELFNICKDYGNKREGSCYTVRKGILHPHNHKSYNYHPNDAFLIEHAISNPQDLVNVFNKYKYFYSYDGFTNLCQIASLCGCIPIIIPFNNYSSISEFWEEPWFTNGIAYGDSEEEINRAINTRSSMISSLEQIKKQNFDLIFYDLINSIIDRFDNDFDVVYEEKINKILLNYNNENIVLVYKNTNNLNNNKLLIHHSNFNPNNIDLSIFNVVYKENINIEIVDYLKNNEINYIFTNDEINYDNYYLITHFYLNLNDKNILINFCPLKYNPTKSINESIINTSLNINNETTTFSQEIYNYRPNYGKSKIVWAPSWSNISNNHWLIREMNKIGKNLYNRKDNLIEVVPTNDNEKISSFSSDISNPINICIYQENNHNPLNMINKIYFNWFFDSFRNKIEYENNSLYIYQFPFYNIKENILRQKYNLPIDINHSNIYPNCLQLCFNIEMIIKLSKKDITNTKRNSSCFVLRKTDDSHPLKFPESIKDYYIHPSNSIQIDNYSLEENINIFLNTEKFYCYDNVSFLPVIASACGCIPILIDKYGGFKDARFIYKKYAPWMYYGMAYADNENEINFAKKTRIKLINLLIKINNNGYKNFFSEKSCREQLLLFLKYIEVYFSVSF